MPWSIWRDLRRKRKKEMTLRKKWRPMEEIRRKRIFRLNGLNGSCRPSEGANNVFFLCEIPFFLKTKINPFLRWALLNEFCSVSACHFVFSFFARSDMGDPFHFPFISIFLYALKEMT